MDFKKKQEHKKKLKKDSFLLGFSPGKVAVPSKCISFTYILYIFAYHLVIDECLRIGCKTFYKIIEL